jgi:zinc protease
MLLEPRWDSVQFELAKIKTINTIEQQEADPNYLASNAMFRLLYGPQHIFSKDILGTKESVAKITLENLKAFYDSNFSPIVSSFNIAGNISPKEVTKALSSLVSRWPAKTVNFPSYTTAQAPEKSTLYFVDVPGAKQSVIYAGHLSLPRTNSEFYDLKVMNFKLGGSFSGILNLILREEKGFTYGARSYFSEMKNPAPFLATTSVRSDATFESVSIYRNVMEKYREGISEEDLNFTRNALIKSNSRRFETIGSLLGMLQSISKYNLPSDYILKEEAVVRNMTADRHKELSSKYINPDHMFYVIAGDAATQLKPLEKIGYGKPIQLN